MYTFQTALDLLADLGPDLSLENIPAFVELLQMRGEFLTTPHIALDLAFMELLALAYDCVVGEMHELIVEFGDIVVDRGKTNVALCVDPNGQRVPVSNQNPLANIEFLLFYDQGVLYVFLNYEGLAFLSFCILEDLVIRPENFDPSPS